MNSSEDKLKTAWLFLFLAWVVAVVASLGSLFFSEIMQYPPCKLCWYQRISMYPLVVVLLVGLFPFEKSVIRFALPLTMIGALIAVFHNLLYYKIIPESKAPCEQGISCTSVHIEWLGFITIPFLSLTAFAMIIFLLILARKFSHEA